MTNKKRQRLTYQQRRALYAPTKENAGAGWKKETTSNQYKGTETYFHPLVSVDDEEPMLGYPKGPRNPLR